jgi:hypothetical protein
VTLRPIRETAEQDADFAYGRMAPGGRRWSESPIPRVATRRVHAGPPPEPPARPEDDQP